MGDGYYDSPGPGYGYTAGPPPGAVAGLLILILVILVVLAIAAVAFRQGAAAAHRRAEHERAKAGGVIFHAVRMPLNGALLATGERIFAPARNVLETIDLYLGPLVVLLGGFGSIQALRKALNTTTKEVEAKHDPHLPPAHAPGSPTIIVTSPALVASGDSLQLVKPVAHGGAHGAHDAGHGHKEKVEISGKEQARLVREALEHLSDFWQEDRVKAQVLAAQKALMISKPIGTVGERAAERAGFFSPRPTRVSNTGSLMRPNIKSKT
ncbi:MAG: hypothetical protein M3N05_09215 [Pseudomonadota bacterium]|nr:hypothetical protein [Pseudomonadota bacterium]